MVAMVLGATISTLPVLTGVVAEVTHRGLSIFVCLSIAAVSLVSVVRPSTL
jgi:hypothetical protein